MMHPDEGEGVDRLEREPEARELLERKLLERKLLVASELLVARELG
jgi:hypothetical protein